MKFNKEKKEYILSQLKLIVGESNLFLDVESKQTYGQDLTQKYTPDPLAIIFPVFQEQIISIVKLANKFKIGLVPSGGRTGYSGGSVAANQELVVSFDKFNRVLEFNADDRQIKCEPGVTTKTIQNLALENDLFYPVDFASSGSSQIGGNVATNAGGIKVIRYGLTRNWVCGLKVITASGDLLELNYGLIKNACGYDFRHLFIGSEGTLGFITEVTLQLTKLPEKTKVLLLAVQDSTHFIDILNDFNSLLSVTAFEFFSRHALDHVLAATGLRDPFELNSSFYVLLEFESSEKSDELVLDIIKKCLDKKWLNDAIVSNNNQQVETFWRYRESISMSLLKHVPYKYDISVLPSKIADFMKEVVVMCNEVYPDFEIVWFGHVGDGNLHLNVLKPPQLTKEIFFLHCDDMSTQLFEIIKKYQGAVSAEHGVGLLKKDFLHYSKNQVEIDYMRSIKKVFDPNGIMNPGKIF